MQRINSSHILIIAMVTSFFLIQCTERNHSNPVDPDYSNKLDVSFSLSANSAGPGDIIQLHTKEILLNPDTYILYFNDQSSPVLSAEEEKTYHVIVPNIQKGSVNVYLKNKMDKSVSNTIHFEISALPGTGKAAGVITSGIVSSQQSAYESIRDVIISNFYEMGILTNDQSDLFTSEINRSLTILSKMKNKIQSLSGDDKKKLDQILYNSGILELTNQLNKHVREMSPVQASNTLYRGHHMCAAVDGFSAILTAINKVWTLSGLIASVGSGGSLAPIVVAGSISMTIMDNGIDGFLPTDLHELSISPQNNITVYSNGLSQVQVMGRFVPQSNPANETIESFVSTLLNLVEIDKSLSFILESLSSFGIDVNGSISNITDNWQNIVYIEHQIDPSYYEGGFGTFLTILGEYLKVSIANGTSQEFLNNISGFDYHIKNPSIAQFDELTSTITGKQSGTSTLVYNGYCFKPQSGLAGYFTLGIEWPYMLENDQIESCNIYVEESAGNRISINTIPSGASIYLDGTNLNLTTPEDLEEIDAGYHHIRLFKSGYNEYNETFNLTEGASRIINVNLGSPLPPLPVFSITSPHEGDTYTDNVITVSGKIQLEDVNGNISDYNVSKAIITLNGVDKEIAVNQGEFSESISILSGQNTIRLRANSDNGDTGISENITIYGNFTSADIEITLTWNTPTSDLDLHVWNPEEEHAYYGNKSISDGFLDIDDIQGYGPETFTSNNAMSGQYIIKINSYDLDEDTYADATVQIQINGGAIHTFGPHHFSVSNEGLDNNPNAWWDVVTFNYPQGLAKSSLDKRAESHIDKIKSDMQNLPGKY